MEGGQKISIDFGIIRDWIAPGVSTDSTDSTDETGEAVFRCEVVDIYGGAEDAGSGRALGSFRGSWSREVPPHGVAFITISACAV